MHYSLNILINIFPDLPLLSNIVLISNIVISTFQSLETKLLQFKQTKIFKITHYAFVEMVALILDSQTGKKCHH